MAELVSAWYGTEGGPGCDVIEDLRPLVDASGTLELGRRSLHALACSAMR